MEQKREPREDFSVSVLKANIYSVLLVGPPVTVFALLYVAIWKSGTLLISLPPAPLGFFLMMAVLVLGVVAHEVLHGITWALAARKPLDAVEFGVQWKALTPYAHCTEPLGIGVYRAGVLMPGLLLGLLPTALGLISGNGWVMLFGLFFTLVAGGDFLMLLLIWRVTSGSLVEDHPTRPGCYVR